MSYQEKTEWIPSGNAVTMRLPAFELNILSEDAPFSSALLNPDALMYRRDIGSAGGAASLGEDGFVPLGEISGEIARSLAVQTALSGKVDKAPGMGLISDDERKKLEDLQNFDDGELRADIAELQEGKLDAVSGTDGINVETVGNSVNLTLKLDENDKVSSLSGNGLMHTLSLFLTGDGVLKLLGRDGAEISIVNLPEHQLLHDAQVVTDPDGQPAGKYLALDFVTESGASTVYIALEDLVDVYTGGHPAISVNASNQIFLVVDVNSHLAVGDAGLGFADGYSAFSSADKDRLDALETTMTAP